MVILEQRLQSGEKPLNQEYRQHMHSREQTADRFFASIALLELSFERACILQDIIPATSD